MYQSIISSKMSVSWIGTFELQVTVYGEGTPANVVPQVNTGLDLGPNSAAGTGRRCGHMHLPAQLFENGSLVDSSPTIRQAEACCHSASSFSFAGTPKVRKISEGELGVSTTARRMFHAGLPSIGRTLRASIPGPRPCDGNILVLSGGSDTTPPPWATAICCLPAARNNLW